jgi:hypothetical protein
MSVRDNSVLAAICVITDTDMPDTHRSYGEAASPAVSNSILTVTAARHQTRRAI